MLWKGVETIFNKEHNKPGLRLSVFLVNGSAIKVVNLWEMQPSMWIGLRQIPFEPVKLVVFY